MKPTHVLITTDLSDGARCAYVPALALAQRLGARVTLLHVVPELKVIPHGAGLAPAQPDPETSRQIEQARAALAAEPVAAPAGVLVERRVIAAEHVGAAIVRHAHEQGADFIALASRGHGALRQALLGSTTQAVLSHADLPVIVYPRT